MLQHVDFGANSDRLGDSTQAESALACVRHRVDSPEPTDEELKTAKPFTEVLPELAANIRKSRGAQKAPTKVAVSIRLGADVLAYYKGQGEKWQSRIDEDLRKLVLRKRKAS